MKSIARAAAAGFAAALILAAAPAPADDAAQVTYAKDIAPIFYANCASCHRPGQIGPMSLMNYEETRPHLKSIRRSVVDDKTMPPWHADPAHGKFRNERRLAAADIEKIGKWIAAGAPKGDPAQMPEPPKFAEGWTLGEPDLILEYDEVAVEAGGTDKIRNLFAKAPTTEDKWIRAIDVQPSNRGVVHHVIAFMPDSAKQEPGAIQGWLGAWAAGGVPQEFPEGTGRLMKAGATVVANIHYHPNGQAGTDKTRIGLYFAKGKVEKEVVNLWIQDMKFQIPPGDGNHEVTASYTFQQDSRLVTLTPHMHYRGKDMKLDAVYPDGRRETLISVPKWDFNWQIVYEPEKQIEMPKGSRIEILAHFDNSTANAFNPDPTKLVRYGPQSTDEMMIGFVDYIVAEGVRPAPPAAAPAPAPSGGR